MEHLCMLLLTMLSDFNNIRVQNSRVIVETAKIEPLYNILNYYLYKYFLSGFGNNKSRGTKSLKWLNQGNLLLPMRGLICMLEG